MKRLLIAGARQLRPVVSRENLRDCYAAVLGLLDIGSEQFRVLWEEPPRGEYCPREYSYACRGLWVDEDSIWTALPGEILEFDTGFRVVRRVSSRLLNDVHHFLKLESGFLVVSTGLDRLVSLEASGNVHEVVTVCPEPAVVSAEDEVDWRGICTKPHGCHPNHVSRVFGRLICTRFNQKDFWDVTAGKRWLAAGEEKPHDGTLEEEGFFYTSVDGTLHRLRFSGDEVCEARRVRIPELVGEELGWCRGVAVQGSRAAVGFSVLRRTAILSNLAFLRGRRPLRRTSVVAIVDHERGVLEKIIETPLTELSIIFALRWIQG